MDEFLKNVNSIEISSELLTCAPIIIATFIGAFAGAALNRTNETIQRATIAGEIFLGLLAASQTLQYPNVSVSLATTGIALAGGTFVGIQMDREDKQKLGKK